jgi:2'-5' RNA ligase
VPRHRLGVVLLLDPPVATEVDGLRRALGDGALGRIAPHITLVSPVNVADRDLAGALAVVREAASATSPLRLMLGPVTTFHPVTPVVYLAVGTDPDAPAAPAALADLRDGVFRPPLARPLTHPFVPHVTLADEMALDRIPAALAAMADYTVPVTVDRVHVLAEGPGRIWRPIADAPFARPAVVARGGLPLELTVTRLVDPLTARLLAHAGPGPGAGEVGSGPWAVTARREGEPVGVAHGITIGDRLEVEALVVAPEHRGQGVGRHLRAAVEHLAGVRSVAWPPIRQSSSG